jgi:hypothetical protein
MPDFQVGQEVLYMPADCHQFEVDGKGERLFHFAWAAGPRAGERMNPEQHGGLRVQRNPAGAVAYLFTGSGQQVKQDGPKNPWKATIKEVTPYGDCWLDIRHPIAGIHLTYRAKYDAAKSLHSFHYEGD